jgi:hypothetical protein
MNEHLWENETDPLALLDALHPMHTHGSIRDQTRQSRMYLLACAHRAWRKLPEVCRVLVHLAEVFVDAPRDEKQLRDEAAPIAELLMNSAGEPGDLLEAHDQLLEVESADKYASVHIRRALCDTRESQVPVEPILPDEWRGLSALVYFPFERKTPTFRWVPRPLHSRRLLREVYGKPYRQAHFSPAWRTDTVRTLARDMYDRREFSAMPILADALEDAGCDDGDILLHCRLPAEHVRGCWVLDLVLDLK